MTRNKRAKHEYISFFNPRPETSALVSARVVPKSPSRRQATKLRSRNKCPGFGSRSAQVAKPSPGHVAT